MSTNHLAMRPSTRLFITLLAALSIIATQMVALAPSPAHAADPVPNPYLEGGGGGWELVRLVIEFDDGDDYFDSWEDPWQYYSNSDISVQGEVVHISCSAHLDEDPGSIGGKQITDWWMASVQSPGGTTAGCDDLDDFPPTPSFTSLTIDKTQVDNRGENAGDETFTFSVVCDDDTDETGIEITGTGTHTVTGIAEDAECSVTETDTADADLTEAGTDQDDLTETDSVEDVDVGTAGATVYFVNTYDAPTEPGTVSLTIDKTQVDNRGEDAADETFTFSVVCDDDTDETGIEITGTGTHTVTGIAEDAECSVTETDTADADLTEAGTDQDDLTETDSVEDVDVGTAGATVYFVNTYDAPDPTTIQLELVKLWLDEDGEPTDARPSGDWNITLTEDEDETNSISVPPSFEGGETGIDPATEWITIEVGNGYTVTESGVGDGWSEVTCTADEIAYINESFGFDVVVSTHGTDSFTAEDDQNWSAHLVCNQQDDDPPPPPTPTPTPDPGEVTVEKIVLGEDAFEDAEFSFILECGTTTEEFTLADGDSSGTFTVAAGMDCTVSETDDQDADLTSWELTGDQVDSGEGTETDGFTVGANDEITVTFTNEFAEVQAEVLEPGISVTKTAIDGVSEDNEGDNEGILTVTIEGEDGSATVTYEVVVTNTGDDDLTDLTLVDDKIGDLTEALIAELEDATLPVGESVTVTADHEVTVADFDGITLTNVVEVVGVGVDSGATVDDSDDETVTLIEVMDVAEEEPTEELPKTGLSSAGLTGLGLLLSMIGAASLLLTRPRREEEAS